MVRLCHLGVAYKETPGMQIIGREDELSKCVHQLDACDLCAMFGFF